MSTLLQFACIVCMLWVLPSIVRWVRGDAPDHWLLRAGAVRAGILLFSALFIAGWTAFAGEVAACAALVIWGCSGDLRTLLLTHVELRSQLIATIAAVRPAKGSPWRYLQLSFLTLLLPALDHVAEHAGTGIAPRGAAQAGEEVHRD